MSSEHTPFAAPAVGVLVLMLSSCALAQEPQPATIAFTGVNVIGLDHEGVDQDQTVLVQGSRIAAVGSRYAVAVPSDGVVIDGTGQYLVPGLTDAHVHLNGTPSPLLHTREDFGDAPLYLAHGVTTVVNLSGTPTLLDWRTRVETGTLLGPTIYTSGPFVNEPRVNTPEEVEHDIVAQAQLGYDLIKFHEFFLSTTTWIRRENCDFKPGSASVDEPCAGCPGLNRVAAATLGVEELDGSAGE